MYFRVKSDCTLKLYVGKTKTLISCGVNMQLICAFDFPHVKSCFTHDAAHILSVFHKNFHVVGAHSRSRPASEAGSRPQTGSKTPGVRPPTRSGSRPGTQENQELRNSSK